MPTITNERIRIAAMKAIAECTADNKEAERAIKGYIDRLEGGIHTTLSQLRMEQVMLSAARAENAELREALADMAQRGYTYSPRLLTMRCAYCGMGEMVDTRKSEAEMRHDFTHAPDCPVLRARALLTTRPAPDAPRTTLSEWDDLAALDD